jgi:heme-degrading monooxygenase HmoA
MIAVVFEVRPRAGCLEKYLEIASTLRKELETIDGFVSIERFQSLNEPDKVLSLSFWRDERSVEQWRRRSAHRDAQARGRETLFEDYRLRVARVLRDYGMRDRDDAPSDSRLTHG